MEDGPTAVNAWWSEGWGVLLTPTAGGPLPATGSGLEAMDLDALRTTGPCHLVHPMEEP